MRIYSLAAAGIFKGSQARGYIFKRDAAVRGGRRCGQSIIHIVNSGSRQINGYLPIGAGEYKVHSRLASTDIERREGTSRILKTKPADPMGKLALKRAQELIIRVQNDGPALRESFKDLGFGLQNTLSGAKEFKVHRTDICDQSSCGADNLSQAGDLPEVVHAHFNDCRLSLRVQIQQRQGDAYVIVIVAHCAQCIMPLPEDGARKFLCRGFSRAARNAYYRQVEAKPILSGNIQKGPAGVGYKEQRYGQTYTHRAHRR